MMTDQLASPFDALPQHIRLLLVRKLMRYRHFPELCEDLLAHAGFAMVSIATLRAIEAIEAAPLEATAEEYANVRYAIAVTKWAELNPLRVMA